ncbi:MAG: hypothetical protein ABEK59_07420 [Halobacteria archaeon]
MSEELANFNFDPNEIEVSEEELPNLAPDQAQEVVNSEMGSGFKIDPARLFPMVRLGKNTQINWQDENGYGVFDFASVDLPEIGKTVGGEDGLSNKIVSVKFVILEPRFGAEQSHFDADSGKPQRFCQTIAAFPDIDGTDRWNKFSDMPLEAPITAPRDYDTREQVKGNAENLVKQKGLYGSKGMFCENCVACGEDKFVLKDENGAEQVDSKGNKIVVSCEGQGELLVAITHFGIKKPDPRNPKKPKFEWVSYDKPYLNTQDDNDNPVQLQLFQAPPIVRLAPSKKMLTRKTPFEVWTTDDAGDQNPDPSASYIPSDVQNVALYLQKLRQETLDDGHSWIQVYETEEGYYRSLYRGLHELWVAKPHQGDGVNNCDIVCMMRGADENRKYLDAGKKGAMKLTSDAYKLYGYHRDRVRTLAQEQGRKLYEPWKPTELREADQQPALADRQDSKSLTQEAETTFNVQAEPLNGNS